MALQPRFEIKPIERRNERRFPSDVRERHAVHEHRVGVVFCGSDEECRQYVGTKIGGLTVRNGRLVDTVITQAPHVERPLQRLLRQAANGCK